MATKMQIQTLKGPNDRSVVFGDLKPWKNTWLVHVKVLHAWKQYIQSVETMEFVLADEIVSVFPCIYQPFYVLFNILGLATDILN